MTFSRNTAIYLIEQCAALFSAAAGVGISASDEENQDPVSLLDEMDPDSEQHRWTQAVLMILRLIHGVLSDDLSLPITQDDEEL